MAGAVLIVVKFYNGDKIFMIGTIHIKSQDARHQYDEQGRAITTWDGPKCAWIVNPEFENDEIDWYGEDSDFAGGMTLNEYEESNPDYKNNPSIAVRWEWNDEAACVRAFGQPHTFLGYAHSKASSFWKDTTYPYVYHKTWDYFSKKEVPNLHAAIEQFSKHAGFHKFADKITVFYNDDSKIIKG